MTRDDFIKLLKKNLKPDAEMDFLVNDYKKTNACVFRYL